MIALGVVRRRRARLVPVVVAVVSLTAAGALFAGAVVRGAPPVTTREGLCAAYVDLRSSLSLSGPAASFAVRTRATRLANLAGHYPQGPSRGSLSAHDAGATITSVLGVPYGTARDLWVAARPVAVECGDDWRTWSPPLHPLLQG